MQCNDITVLNGYARSMSVEMNHKLKKKLHFLKPRKTIHRDIKRFLIRL